MLPLTLLVALLLAGGLAVSAAVVTHLPAAAPAASAPATRGVLAANGLMVAAWMFAAWLVFGLGVAGLLLLLALGTAMLPAADRVVRLPATFDRLAGFGVVANGALSVGLVLGAAMLA